MPGAARAARRRFVSEARDAGGGEPGNERKKGPRPWRQPGPPCQFGAPVQAAAL